MSFHLRSLAFLSLALTLAAIAPAAPQLGIQTWTLRKLNFEQAVEFAAAHGITQLELYSDHLDPNAPKEENLKKLAFLQSHGVTAYSVGVSRTFPTVDENRPLFELAKLFGMTVIVVEPRIDDGTWDALETLVKEYNIRLAIHNHGTGTIYGNPATVKAVLAKRDPRIGVCLDIGWVTAAGFDAAAVFRNYGDRVFDMHLKDKRLDQKDDRDRPNDTFIGLGNANLTDLFTSIRESKWSGVMAIETDSAEFADSPDAFVTSAKTYFDAHVSKK